MIARTSALFTTVAVVATLSACDSSPFDVSELDGASFEASVHGSLAAEYSGLGLFTSFQPPAGVPRPAHFSIHSSDRRRSQREAQHFVFRRIGAERPEVGRYSIGRPGGDADFDMTYARFTGTGSAMFAGRDGELEITVSTPERIEGTFSFTGVRTCTGTAHALSCRFDPEAADDPEAPTITVSGSFVALDAPRGTVVFR